MLVCNVLAARGRLPSLQTVLSIHGLCGDNQPLNRPNSRELSSARLRTCYPRRYSSKMQSNGNNDAAVKPASKAKAFEFNVCANTTSTIILESAEGVRFMVDRASLSALSSVFSHMMSACKEDGKPLRLAEDQYTLALLCKIVGKTELIPKMPIATLAKAIKAADKYDMLLVRVRLEHHAM